ncbi:MAG: ABC transporter permease [Treponema sp.]|nr:ABC transporter permease [Treponema sp.]
MSLNWIFFVSRRFAKVDRKGSSLVTTILATLGICFGVMTLITVISVMNGFQHSFIDVIMEISSYHVRVTTEEPAFEEHCKNNSLVRSVTPFYEAQSLMTGPAGKESASMIKAVPEDVREKDEGFKKYVNMVSGSFDLSDDCIVLGTELSRRIGARIGSKVNLYALSGGNDVDLFSSDRVFTVTGIFHTGYGDINSSFAFINLSGGKKYFGKDSQLVYGVKLFDENDCDKFISKIKKEFQSLECESWKSYNRSFFGALQVEKNMLMFLVFLIFLVVAINIFNGMRRMVYERREEISVLSAFGARGFEIKSIFVMQGFMTGFFGAVPGMFLGILITLNMDSVFMLLSKASYYASLLAVMLTNPGNVDYVMENPMFLLYASIPPRIFWGEVAMITLFGIFSSLIAAFFASRTVLKLTIAQIMRDE